ncbi:MULTISPECIES: hypothetical protein [unclassified Streptomyces]|uniref:hypothetical protein n=1 Tax=unclassified Streptomyces TaxID=2593676 RepID=UPI000B50ACE1|nr:MULTISPECIES: hypothetical protein [unclassified Streptomyces]MYX01902.1 hypothetical protein [Streptomyces sp. SID8378]SNB56444.1 hypothetical protein SAMN02745831_00017 [Streptomyces sp. PgraA7]
MSDEKQGNLTPAEQREQDDARVKIQMAQTDISEAVRNMPFASAPAGRTSFEGFQLNSMIDLVEKTKPEDLENAGKALWDARDAIKKAAQELEDNMKGVDWHGESGTAFRAFGKGLVAHARKLGDFADVAGTQITVAGTGLASVRSAMPPRDSRQVRKSPDDIEMPGRVADNPEYQAALKVEKDRQEAINQINRLASYYSVSGERLEGQEPPRFDKDLGITMPPPVGGVGLPGATEGSSRDVSVAGGGAGESQLVRNAVGASEPTSASDRRPVADALGSAPVLDRGTATEINSVAPPQAPTTITGTPPQPSPTPTTGPTVAPPTPIPPNLTNPVKGGTQRATGPSGMPRTVSQVGHGMGKAQPTGVGPVAKGQGGSPIGRPGPMGGGGTFNGRPPVGPQSQVPTAGRPAVGPGGTSSGAGPRAGGRNGIVGGTPQQVPPQGRAAAAGGSAQRGVIGGRGAAAAPSRPGGRATPASGANGVVGAPRKAAGTGSNPNGFTAGGAGLVRGPAGRRNNGREDEVNGSTRPDYLTEDEETWNAGRRGAVPPVVE